MFRWERRNEAFVDVLHATGDILLARANVSISMLGIVVEPVVLVVVATVVCGIFFALLLPMLLLVKQLGDVVYVVDHRVVRAYHPLRVAVAAQVRSDHVIAVAQFAGDPVPVAAVVPRTMHEDQERRVGIPPVHVVQTQALRKIGVRSRAVQV